METLYTEFALWAHMVYIRNHEISTPLLDPARPVIPFVLLGYLLCSCSFCYTSCICTFRTMCDMRPRDKVARYCSGIFWLSGVRDPDQIRMGPMFNSSAVEWSLLIFSGRILCIASNQHYLLHHFVKITVYTVSVNLVVFLYADYYADSKAWKWKLGIL